MKKIALLGLVGASLFLTIWAQTPPPKQPVSDTPPDYIKKYGNILQIGPTSSTPLKLNFPWPTVGELVLPTPDEMEKRIKLEHLALLSDKEILLELNAWPPYQKMSLGDQGKMLSRIQDIRDHRAKVATDKAHELGLILNPDQQSKFEKRYWMLRLQADQDLLKKVVPLFQEQDDKLKTTILKEFSAPANKPTSR